MTGQAKGKASEVSGEAKGKASEVAGQAKGKANEVSGKVWCLNNPNFASCGIDLL